MPRRPEGTIDIRPWTDGRTTTYRLRVPWRGRRVSVHLGTNHEGWSEERALVELERIMGAIERATWHPPEAEQAPAEPEDATFHLFASEWWAEKQATIDATTRADYLWRLERYLVPFFKDVMVSRIDVRLVDRFRRQLLADREAVKVAAATGKPIMERREIRKGARAGTHYMVAKRPLSNRSINMFLDLLAQILEQAVDYRLLDANPAEGKRRRLAVEASPRTFLEADEVVALLDAAGELDAEARVDRQLGRRAALAELVLAGDRISGLCDRKWRHVDLGHARFVIPDAKTPAGVREVEMPLFLVDELSAHRQTMAGLGRKVGPAAYVYGTHRGGRRDPNRFRDRILERTVARANERRAEQGLNPLPDHVTPHTLRRTYITLALSAGRDPKFVMGQVGHTDAKFTLRVYAQVMKRQRQDDELIWELMRFADESEGRPARRGERASAGGKRTAKGTTGDLGADAGRVGRVEG